MTSFSSRRRCNPETMLPRILKARSVLVGSVLSVFSILAIYARFGSQSEDSMFNKLAPTSFLLHARTY